MAAARSAPSGGPLRPDPVDPTAPALFEGTVGHRRSECADHRFRLGVFYAYLDVEAVADTLDPLPGWSATGPAPMRFRPEDHLDGARAEVGEAVRDLVEQRTGRRPGGKVMLLTQLRALGFVFNPISVFYCWSSAGDHLDALVLEVTNTPWNERCWYVLDPRDCAEDGTWRFPKQMHVSPFLDMDLTYVVRATEPSDTLRLRIDDRRGEDTVLSADLALRRVPLDRRHAVSVPLRHPLQTWRVFAAIHGHAVRLWRKGVPIHRHPARAEPVADHDLAQPNTGGHPMAGPSPDRVARTVLFAALDRLRGGRLTIVDGASRRTFGGSSADRYGRAPLDATIRVHDPAAFRRVLRHGSTGLGETYAEGLWDADDLTAALRLIDRRVRSFDPMVRTVRRVTAPLTDPVRRLRRQDRDRDRIDIQTHYDLGNEFFERLLDPTMMYSAARFSDPGASLEEASAEKLDQLCRRLGLGPSDHVLEIGTGWGGFAEHAASRYGCRVTTTTISAEQHRYATERIARAGLADRVTVLDRDYRDLVGEVGQRYDAIVSIEMIEAVDWREYDTFHRVCGELLAPDGRLGMQAIVIPGQRYEQAKVSTDFIKAKIFPGGCLPSVEALLASSARVGDLTLTQLDDFGLHYAETLRRWRRNLASARGELHELGLDEHFARLWEFYLAYCEAGFDERDISVVQMVLTRPGNRSGDADGFVTPGSGSGNLHAVA